MIIIVLLLTTIVTGAELARGGVTCSAFGCPQCFSLKPSAQEHVCVYIYIYMYREREIERERERWITHIMYYTMLYYTTLYYTVLYYTILYYATT